MIMSGRLDFASSYDISGSGLASARTIGCDAIARTLTLEQGKPLVFGAQKEKGIRLEGFRPTVVELGNGVSTDDLWIHDEKDFYKAQILVRMFDDPRVEGHLPRPFGVFYEAARPCYEEMLNLQVEEVIATKGKGDLDKLLRGNEIWTIS